MADVKVSEDPGLRTHPELFPQDRQFRVAAIMRRAGIKSGPEHIVHDLQARSIEFIEAREITPSLEDVFVSLTRQSHIDQEMPV